jgi:hypothetical protein
LFVILEESPEHIEAMGWKFVSYVVVLEFGVTNNNGDDLVVFFTGVPPGVTSCHG